MLDKKECQAIIDRLFPILDKDINIIGLDGKIIASSNNNRIDSIHEGAKLCVKNRKEHIIKDANYYMYKGCNPGINLPLYYEDRIIGVIGINGNPDEIKSIALIVKELVEHIIYENENQKFKVKQQDALRSFVVELFNLTSLRDYTTLESRAKLLGFHYEEPKMLILGDIHEYEGFDEGISMEIVKQRIYKSIKHYLETDDVCMILYEHLFLIIMKWRGNLESYLTKIIDTIFERYQVKLRLVVGGYCNKLEDYNKRFNVAKRLLDMDRVIKIQAGVHFAEKFDLELLLGSLNRRSIIEYLERYEHIFCQKPMDHGTIEIIETIRVYYEQNMNIGETASVLYVHRNTVGYRLNKFKEQYKININKPYECMKLYIAIKLYDHYGPLDEGVK